MRLRFAPPKEHQDCPSRQVHYGYDFSGGAVCDVKEPELVKKLLGTRHFTQAEVPSDASVFHDENLPMRRRKRVTNGNHNQG